MFIVILKYKKPIDVVDQFLVEHRSFLDEHYKNDAFIASGPMNPRNGGIFISQLKDKEQLQSILQKDPFYLNDIAEYEILEFHPVKHHKNFASFMGIIE